MLLLKLCITKVIHLHLWTIFSLCIFKQTNCMRISFTLLFCLISYLSQSQNDNVKNRFTLTSEIAGHDSITIYLGYVNSSGKYVRDSAFLQNGRVTFSGQVNEPTRATLVGKVQSRSIDDPNIVEFYIEPGLLQASFIADQFKKGKFPNTETNTALNVYNSQRDSLTNKWKPVFDAVDEARARGEKEYAKELVSKEFPRYRAESQQLAVQFIKGHPGSYLSAELLYYQSQQLHLDSLKLLYALLTPRIKDSRNGREIRSFIFTAESLAIGMKAPNFSAADQHGKQVSLSDFAGKYVLVDFWASWCVPCRQEHPYMRKAIEKYGNKGFTIVSVSLDKQEDKKEWLAAIEKDQLSWTQLCDFKAWESTIVSLYNLLGKGIPANFLIGPGGEIMAKDLRGQALDQELSKVFQ